MNDLASKQCVPCMGGVPPLQGPEIKRLLDQLSNDWIVVEDHHLEKEYAFDMEEKEALNRFCHQQAYRLNTTQRKRPL